MGQSNSSYAMASKARAMFGKRLKSEDFQTLLQKRSIVEIASFLKNETYYKDALEGVNEGSVHRGQLEALIRRDLFTRYSNLMRYEPSGSNFYRYGILLNEVEQILACIRSFNSQDKYQMISKMPIFIEKNTSFDLKELAQAVDFPSLFKVLEKTSYVTILKPYAVNDMAQFDYTSCEIALKKYYYEEVMKIIESDFKGQEKREIKDVFLTQIELENITKIFRYKKYFHASDDEIKRSLNPIYLRINKKSLDDMIENTTAEEFLEKLSLSAYQNFIDHKDFKFIEYHTGMINYNLNKKHIMFSSNSNLVLLSYMFLSETEIENLIDIIEGVRYSISPEKIEKMMIY